ncbi:MAG: hypothetical protein JRJ04_18415 [Deltaproteobacteria bacterium]|nr:hypothetical protein [Deltaproteobacteria bacterium]MBW1995346.1 hypothetical protein [Deltaproteobacteria bacterium]
MGIKIADARLKFAVEFTWMDLDQLRPGDWLNLRDDLKGFLGSPLDSAFYRREAYGILCECADLENLGREDIRELQSKLKTALGQIAKARVEIDEDSVRIGTGLTQNVPIPSVSLRAVSHPKSPFVDRDASVVVIAEGTLQDVFMLKTFMLLSFRGPERIKLCPECGRVFYKIGKQKYCTPQCVSRTTTRKYERKKKTSSS